MRQTPTRPAASAAGLACFLALAAADGAAACGESYTVRRGDSLSAIARRCGTTVSSLLGANPAIADPDLIRVGQVLRLVATAAGRDDARPVETAPRAGTADRKRSVRVTGRLTGEGVECQALRGDDGRLYTLTGDLKGFKTGDRVTVEGTVAEISICMQGTTLGVTSIEAAQ